MADKKFDEFYDKALNWLVKESNGHTLAAPILTTVGRIVPLRHIARVMALWASECLA